MSTELSKLISRLDNETKITLQQATALCQQYQHSAVELEHWLFELVNDKNSILHQLLEKTDINIVKLKQDINQSLESIQKTQQQVPTLSNTLIDWIEAAWLLCSLDYGKTTIDSGALLIALLQNRQLNQVANSISATLKTLRLESIQAEYTKQKPQVDNITQPKPSTGKSLERFATNLNALAKSGNIDAVIGREFEIQQTIDILARRRQNNAILTGEPGVGKTAIAEGLALKIVRNEVPPHLKNTVIYSLDLNRLQAGASLKGEFENRLTALLDEIKQSEQSIILFIDEAHTLIGAGNQAGQGDAANLLKPALARGELRCIAATTWAEYKQYFEKDAALTRRFQVVKINEPSEDIAIDILSNMAEILEKHHGVTILDNAIQAAVHLSHRYLSERMLPDKAISVLDTACSRAAKKINSKPLRLELAEEKLKRINEKIIRLEKESERGLNHKKAIKQFKKTEKKLKSDIQTLLKDWKKSQKSLKESIIDVNEAMIAAVLSDWTGIPLGNMQADSLKSANDLEKKLEARVLGQSQAIKVIADTVRTSLTKLEDPNKPAGVFLLLGPSGVGKTETALALAESVYGSEHKVTTINMSEFKEPHKAATLLGAPPGYVGYGEGGVLTEAVRRTPYSLILLDEMEKAHPSIHDIFYQIFDKGFAKDGQGRHIDFKNTIIIMTSNACTDEIAYYAEKYKNKLDIENLNEAIAEPLLQYFKPAFIGRCVTLPYLPLDPTLLNNIAELKLKKLQDRMKTEHNIQFHIDKKVIQFIVSQCTQQHIGARQINNIIAKSILPLISQKIIASLSSKRKLKTLNLAIKNKQFFVENPA